MLLMSGLIYLTQNSVKCMTSSVACLRDLSIRIKRVGKERVERDEGMFTIYKDIIVYV